MVDYQEAAYKHSSKIRDEAREHLKRRILDGAHIEATQKRCIERLPKY